MDISQIGEPTVSLCSGVAEIPVKPTFPGSTGSWSPAWLAGFAVSAVTKHFSSREDVPAWGWYSAVIQICKMWLNNTLVPENRGGRGCFGGQTCTSLHSFHSTCSGVCFFFWFLDKSLK